MASTVPKFASFRPKPKLAPEPPEQAKESQEPRKAHGRSKSSKERGHRRRPESPLAGERKHEQTPEQRGRDPRSKPYFSDRRGDANILRYGTMNHYEVPVFRRYGYGYVLGLGLEQKIDRSLSTDKEVHMTPATRQRQERLLTGRLAAKESHRPLRFIKAQPEESAVERDFISVSATRVRDEESEEDTNFRSIEHPSTLPVDADTQFESDTEPANNSLETTKKNSELVRRTREDPEDLQAWLDFIDHQEAMVMIDRPLPEMNAATRQQLAEVRISTFEEALKKIGSNVSSQIILWQGLLDEARRSWDDSKLASKWKVVLAKYQGPHSTLWLQYLDFVQSSFAPFKYEVCREAFLQCLGALQGHAEQVPTETVLHLCIRMLSLIHGAGYQELALAAWQAIFEYQIFLPTGGSLESFEQFWETEQPRIGEPGAKGWKNCGQAVPSEPQPTSQPLNASDPTDTTFSDFANREADSRAKLRYPGRTTDEVGEDDAFHTIFFTDIAEYLKALPTATSTLLVEAFLCFCGLPPLPRAAEHQRTWWTDSFLQHHHSKSSSHDGEDAQIHQSQRRFSETPLKLFQMTSHLLFDQEFSLDPMRLDASFVRRLLSLIACEPASEDVIGEYLLAFETRHFPSEVPKTAKRLLKARPASQRLYNAYALAESCRGNATKADQVFSMALSMCSGSSITLSTSDNLRLFSSWCWEVLRRGDTTEALWRLSSLGRPVAARSDANAHPDVSTLLHARTALGEACERALLANDYFSAVTGNALLALFTYLSGNMNIVAAIDIQQHLTSWFVSHKLSASSPAELHAQEVARLLNYYLTHAPIVKPAIIRAALEPRVAQFPDNTQLLSLYTINEARFSIDDRVRGIMQNTVLQRSDYTSAVGWAFAIHYETLRNETAGSTSHSIRALYERAVTSSGAHCPPIWTLYLRFELTQLSKARDKGLNKKPHKEGKTRGWENGADEAQARVKEMFYKGLRSLPWCKDFAMLAFTDANDVFGEDELWKIYRVMQEKEMRLYVELDDGSGSE